MTDNQIRFIIKLFVHSLIAGLICIPLIKPMDTFQWIVIIANLIFFGYLACRIYIWERHNDVL